MSQEQGVERGMAPPSYTNAHPELIDWVIERITGLFQGSRTSYATNCDISG